MGWVIQHFLKTEIPESIAPQLVYQLEKLGLDVSKGPAPVDVVIALRERVQTLKEMAEKAVVWYVPLESYDQAAVAKHLKAGDVFVIEPGMKGTWEVVETVRKYFVFA